MDAAADHVVSTYGRLDILVNNAGIFSKNPIVREAARETLAANVVGSVSVTEAFVPLLRKSSAPRLIFVSSSVGSISQAADPKSPYFRPAGNEYRASKAALNMYVVQYHNKLSVVLIWIALTVPLIGKPSRVEAAWRDMLGVRGLPPW